MTDIESIASVARAAVLSAGEELRIRWQNDKNPAEYGSYDVSALADKAAESRILPVIRQSFPDHALYAEESGTIREQGPFRWIVDPLDGTNNFVTGQPAFASSVAVLSGDVPLVAAVHLPITRETYIARRGKGVYYGGNQVSTTTEIPLGASTVVMIQGRNVDPDPKLSSIITAIERSINDITKRIVDSWAPTVHSGLFARGQIQGLVQFYPDREERAVTELFVREANAVVRQEDELYVAAHDEQMCQQLWRAITDHK